MPAMWTSRDKERAADRTGIFMIDASKGFIKDGNKNRLRAMDIHRIVDVFTKQTEQPTYARMVSFEEIEKNEFNLNIPRYIDAQEAEDLQDIAGHLLGGIPQSDVDGLGAYWKVCPQLRETLFTALRPGYQSLAVESSAIKEAIYNHPEFAGFMAQMEGVFANWRAEASATLKALEPGCHPKSIIVGLGEALLAHYAQKPLMDRYDVYQHLMDYWAEVMQDDCYLIAAEGWKAEPQRIIETDKKGKEKDKGWACDLVPKGLIVARYFAKEQAELDEREAQRESLSAHMAELEEEHGGEEGLFSELEKVNKGNVSARLKEIKGEPESEDEAKALNAWLKFCNQEAAKKKAIKEAEAALDAMAYEKYSTLSEEEIKLLVVEDKWLASLATAIHGETDRISQALTGRVKELVERYATPLPQATRRVAALEEKVSKHLERMGFSWM